MPTPPHHSPFHLVSVEIIHPNEHSGFCTSRWFKSVHFYSVYDLFKVRVSELKETKNQQQKKHSPILLFNIYKEAELQKGKGIFRAGGGVGTKIQVRQVHSIFFFFFWYSWQHYLWIQKTSLSFLFPRVAGNEVKWVGKAETCLMREDFHFISINICWESGPLLVWDDRDKRTVHVHGIMSSQARKQAIPTL